MAQNILNGTPEHVFEKYEINERKTGEGMERIRNIANTDYYSMKTTYWTLQYRASQNIKKRQPAGRADKTTTYNLKNNAGTKSLGMVLISSSLLCGCWSMPRHYVEKKSARPGLISCGWRCGKIAGTENDQIAYINPGHLYFNALNSIRALVGWEPERASQTAITELSTSCAAV